MRPWTYPIIALIFNIILFESFPLGGGGISLGVYFTIPIIAIASLLLTAIHYRLINSKPIQVYFQTLCSVAIIFLSYFLFITEPDNKPFDIVKRMALTADNYGQIEINDFFLEPRYYNFEKIVASKKKYSQQIPDTTFRVNVYKLYEYGHFIENYGIIFNKGRPTSTNEKVIIRGLKNNTFKFIEQYDKDSLTFTASSKHISSVKGRIDSFTTYGTGYMKEPDLRTAQTSLIRKDDTPDNEYFAYRVFYWLL